MGVFLLRVKAEQEHVEHFRPPPGMPFCLDLKQADGDEIRKKVVVDPNETVEVRGKSEANLCIRWPGSKREGTVTIISIKGPKAPRALEESDSDFVTFAAFECRGAEPVKWHQLEQLLCEITEGKTFSDVDLSEDDTWCDYDDENDLPVSIANSKFSLSRTQTRARACGRPFQPRLSVLTPPSLPRSQWRASSKFSE